MKNMKSIMAAALASAASAFASTNRIYGAQAIKRHLQQQKRDHLKGSKTSIAKLNRHTGQPHEHRREIARRLRQQRAA